MLLWDEDDIGTVVFYSVIYNYVVKLLSVAESSLLVQALLGWFSKRTAGSLQQAQPSGVDGSQQDCLVHLYCQVWVEWFWSTKLTLVMLRPYILRPQFKNLILRSSVGPRKKIIFLFYRTLSHTVLYFEFCTQCEVRVPLPLPLPLFISLSLKLWKVAAFAHVSWTAKFHGTWNDLPCKCKALCFENGWHNGSLRCIRFQRTFPRAALRGDYFFHFLKAKSEERLENKYCPIW